jgi:predicted component of type VI protein secretion system
MSTNPALDALKQREKTLVEKVKKLKAGDLNAAEFEGDRRQEEAIVRNEKWLRDVRKEIEAIEHPKPKK